MMETSMSPVESVFSLYRKHGQSDYLGEAINQVEHATQCAMLAEKEGFSNEVSAPLHQVPVSAYEMNTIFSLKMRLEDTISMLIPHIHPSNISRDIWEKLH